VAVGQSESLILFTDSYPHGTTEPFLETEIKYLAEAFTRVEIIPRRYSGQHNSRPLPTSVHCWSPLMPEHPLSGLLSALPVFSPFIPLIKEATTRRVWQSFLHIRKWLEATALIRHGLRHPRVQQLLRNPQEQTICYFYWGLGAAWLAPFLPTHTTKLARFHGYDVYEERPAYRGYMPYRRQLLRSLDYAACVSEHGYKYLKERYKSVPWQGGVSRLGVEDFGQNPRSTSEPFRLVSCSSLVPVKRVHLIAEALKNIQFPVHWTHFGDGPQRSTVMQAVKNMPKHVQCDFPGLLPNAQIRKALATKPFDLFLNVSESEGAPVSIMEALSSGIPVLATAVGGIPELVDDSVGRLLPVEVAPKQLATAIIEMKDSPQRLIDQAVAARKRWQDQADAAANYSGFATLLQNLTSGGKE